MIVDYPWPPWWGDWFPEGWHFTQYLGWYYSKYVDLWFNQQDLHPIKIRPAGEDFEALIVYAPEEDYPYWTLDLFRSDGTYITIDSMSLTMRGIFHLIEADDEEYW